MGVFEWETGAAETMMLAQTLADSQAHSVVGGGDSIAALKAKLTDRIQHVSTGGGASIEYLEGPLTRTESLMP